LNNGDSVFKNVSEIEKLNEKRKYLSDEFYKEALLKVNLKDNVLFYISPAIDH
jgi:single-stranded DNA-specific DHH superfamily exonuclease